MDVRAGSKRLWLSGKLGAVGDQLAMVAGNFCLNMLVARNVGLHSFGVFSAWYALVVLASFVHGAVIADTLSLSREQDSEGQLSCPSPWKAIWTVSIPLVVAFMLAGMAINDEGSMLDIALLGSASLASMMYWTCKAEMHALGRHNRALGASVIASVVMVGAAVLMLGAIEGRRAGLIAISLGALAPLALRTTGGRAVRLLTLSDIRRNVFVALPLAVMSWGTSNLVLVYLAWANAERLAAGMRAVLTSLLPVNQVLVGLSLFSVPHISLLLRTDRNLEARAFTKGMLALSMAAALCFGGFSYAFAPEIIVGLFGRQFAVFSDDMRALSILLPLCWSVVTAVRSHLRASHQPKVLLYTYGLTQATALPVALWMLYSSTAKPWCAVLVPNAALALGMAAKYLGSASHRGGRAEHFSFDSDRRRKAMLAPWLALAIVLAKCSVRDKRIWVFGRRTGVGDGPLALAEAVKAKVADARVHWVCQNNNDRLCAASYGFTPITATSMRGLLICLRAGYAVMSHGFSDVGGPAVWGARTIQLWHGAPLKRIGLDRCTRDRTLFGGLIGRLARAAERYWNSHYSHIVASSPLVAGRLQSAFGVDHQKLVVCGDPRLDLMLRAASGARETLATLAGESNRGSRFVLFAPTWRDRATELAGMDCRHVQQMLDATNTTLFLRRHPHSRAQLSGFNSSRVIELGATAFPDLTALLGGFDLIITDYSSVAMDFAVLERPIVLAAPDHDEYSKSPGLYEDYSLFACGGGHGAWDQAFREAGAVLSGSVVDLDRALARSRHISARYHSRRTGNASRQLLAAIGAVEE